MPMILSIRPKFHKLCPNCLNLLMVVNAVKTLNFCNIFSLHFFSPHSTDRCEKFGNKTLPRSN